VLKKAIKGLSKDKLCLYLSNIVDEYPHTAQQLEKQLLVKGKDVVRYHADPKSEDECDPDEQGGDLEERHAIAVADEDFTPRYAQCLSCKEEFDVSENAKGSCCWHSGNSHPRSCFPAQRNNIADYVLSQEPRAFTSTPTFGLTMMWIATEHTSYLRTIQTLRKVSSGTAANKMAITRVANAQSIKRK